ncbi:hypothetical protein [Hellea balneolensis]|uniref:hypothetical protein n=1 Tax=Hellea balneolensis TaxID=287478 RepID=UPI00041A98E0|nr:hypothetical protein [Hellea balneolensis]
MHPFVENKCITDLGFGSGFALWGFRAIASGKTGCCHFTAGFNRAFSMDNDALKSQHGGTAGRLAMNALKSFSYQLGVLGTRKITLSSPGTFRVTADELSIVAALAAAQEGRDDLCHLHLTWLLAQHDTVYARHAAVTYGIICAQADINIESLASEGVRPPSKQSHPIKAQQVIGALY